MHSQLGDTHICGPDGHVPDRDISQGRSAWDIRVICEGLQPNPCLFRQDPGDRPGGPVGGVLLAAAVFQNHAAAQTGDPDSIFSYYKSLIRLRKEYGVISQGDFTPLDPQHPCVLAYRRSWKAESLLCVNNFYRKPCTWTCPAELSDYRVLLSNYPDPRPAPEWHLRPYESVILLKRG